MKRRILVVACALAAFLGTGSWQAAADDSSSAGGKGKELVAGTDEYVRWALSKSVSIDVTDEPLDKVVQELGKQAKVTFEIDVRALDAVGIEASAAKVTASLQNLPLRSCLRVILRELKLTYTVDEGALRITTPEEAEQHLKIAVLDVSDLLGIEEEAAFHASDYDMLIQVITLTVAPNAWDEVGGSGSIFGFRGTIVLHQTDEVIDQICQFLAAVRQGKQITAKHGDSPPPVDSIWVVPDAQARSRIEKALDSKADFEFLVMPLDEVVANLGRKYQIPMRLSESALGAEGVSPKQKVTFAASNVTLRIALRRWFDELKLTYSIREGVLLVTTPDDAELNLVTRVYLVQDLVGSLPRNSFGWLYGSLSSEDPIMDYDSLIELITVMLPTFSSYGRPAPIDDLSAYGLLVISGTEQVHWQIERLFAKLRKTIPAVAKIPLAKPADDELRTAVYSVPGTPWGSTGEGQKQINPSEREVLTLITSIIEPESWRKRDDVFAHSIKERLVIRHTNAVHREIRELARKLEIWGFRESGVYTSDGFCKSIIPVVGDKQLPPADSK